MGIQRRYQPKHGGPVLDAVEWMGRVAFDFRRTATGSLEVTMVLHPDLEEARGGQDALAQYTLVSGQRVPPLAYSRSDPQPRTVAMPDVATVLGPVMREFEIVRDRIEAVIAALPSHSGSTIIDIPPPEPP